jgi:hypothetical protein
MGPDVVETSFTLSRFDRLNDGFHHDALSDSSLSSTGPVSPSYAATLPPQGLRSV